MSFFLLVSRYGPGRPDAYFVFIRAQGDKIIFDEAKLIDEDSLRAKMYHFPPRQEMNLETCSNYPVTSLTRYILLKNQHEYIDFVNILPSLKYICASNDGRYLAASIQVGDLIKNKINYNLTNLTNSTLSDFPVNNDVLIILDLLKEKSSFIFNNYSNPISVSYNKFRLLERINCISGTYRQHSSLIFDSFDNIMTDDIKLLRFKYFYDIENLKFTTSQIPNDIYEFESYFCDYNQELILYLTKNQRYYLYDTSEKTRIPFNWCDIYGFRASGIRLSPNKKSLAFIQYQSSNNKVNIIVYDMQSGDHNIIVSFEKGTQFSPLGINWHSDSNHIFYQLADSSSHDPGLWLTNVELAETNLILKTKDFLYVSSFNRLI